MSDDLIKTIDLDSISDEDFDFLCDTALNLVFETINLTEADSITLNKINDRLDSDKYDLNVELNTPTQSWWQDEELPDLLNSGEEDNGLSLDSTTLELNVISITNSGSHAGERVVVASVHLDVGTNLTNIKEQELNNIQIKWLPELAN